MGSGFFKALSFSGNNANVTTNPDGSGLEQSMSAGSINRNQSGDNLDKQIKGNKHFMRKLPPGSEASNIMVGEVPFLEKPASAFIRLSKAANMGNMTEVPVPTRFIYIILGPVGGLSRYHEIGRSMATLMSDEVFHEVAYKAKNRSHLLAGVDEFLDAVTVLPPGEWDPAIRIEPPSHVPSQDKRKKNPDDDKDDDVDEEEEEQKGREASGLTRTGRLFGGLINDLKRKQPFYLSDFKDAFAVQTLASFFFLYFACLTPIITFGGLLGEATDNSIASMESLVAGLICGVIYGFFSGQPLTILGSTGPVLVFESILFEFCKSMDWQYLSFRLWVGVWCSLILIILVAVDASAMVCYITRFTEENFATLISAIFIVKAIEKVAKIGTKYPMETHVDHIKDCYCEQPKNWTDFDNTPNWTFLNSHECHEQNAKMVGIDCLKYEIVPDVYLLSLILFIGTFLLSTSLKNFKTASFFPTKVRGFISDFAVVIAIFLMVGLDYSIGIHTPKLQVPSKFAPTRPDRGWLIHPFNGNPWWSGLVAVVPALLACILIFMDQQITAVIVNRKEHKLKKGGGYHLDLLCVGILIGVNSVFGLPWFVAATVLSINHVNSLKIESESAAPGETPQFLGIREQRVTHILIFLCIGLSVFVTQVLRLIPMAVLFGVFMYMGIAGLKGMQFFDRILIMFMPGKYQPDFAFLRQVPIKRVHLFTSIQLFCLAGLWIIKSFPQTSILFPLMLVIMIVARKMLDRVFTQHELKVLDDVLPEFNRKKRIQKEADKAGKEDNEIDGADNKVMTIPMANGNVMKVPMVPNPINITEELNKSGLWQDINESDKDNKNNKENKDHESSRDSCRKCRRRKRSKHEQNGDIVKSVANGHADIEMDGSPVCPGHNETEKNMPQICLENENESSRL